ncbi:MAG: hypothetical protein QOG82_765 [Actinomycetota bacterium]|nr:hypothetical protein [Actinomycetota bacterium]
MLPRRLIRRNLHIAAGLLALLILTAATPSANAAAAPVSARQQPVGRQDATVEGVAVHADGSPAEGVSVSVVGYDNAGFAGIVTTLFSLGLACFADRVVCLGESTEGGAMTTGADGRYHGTLPDSFVAGTETDTDWVVTAGLPATGDQAVGPRSTFEFEVNILIQAAAPLPVWEATPSVSVDGWQATASVDSDLPAGTSRPVITVGGSATQGTDGSIDLRLLESEGADAEILLAYATAYADVRVPHANGRTIYHQAVSTGAVALPALDLVPPSRGAPCTMVTAAGSPPPEVSDGCTVTDGNRSNYVPAGVASLTVDLPSAVDVSAVFLAGARDGTTVEISGDGTSWSSLATNVGTPASGVLVASPDSPTAARFVRVSRGEGLDGLNEVSVWSGPDAARATPPPTSGASSGPMSTPGGSAAGEAAAAPGTEATDGGNRTGTLVVALVVLCLVGAAIGGLGWARSRRSA